MVLRGCLVFFPLSLFLQQGRGSSQELPDRVSGAQTNVTACTASNANSRCPLHSQPIHERRSPAPHH